MRVSYEAFLKDYNNPFFAEKNRYILEITKHDFEKIHGYKVSIGTNGLMKIEASDDGLGVPMPDSLIKTLEKIGFKIEEIMTVDNIDNYSQLCDMEIAARKRKKTILRVETLKDGLGIRIGDIPYGWLPEEETAQQNPA